MVKQRKVDNSKDNPGALCLPTGLDLFDSNSGTVYNGHFGLDGSTWLRPTAILNARFVQFSVTVNY